MLLGILLVKPIPLPPAYHDSEDGMARYPQSQSGEESSHAISRVETDARVPLLSSLDSDDLNAPPHESRTPLRSGKDIDASLPNISGLGLAVSVEFWLLAIITTLCESSNLLH